MRHGQDLLDTWTDKKTQFKSLQMVSCEEEDLAANEVRFGEKRG